MRRFESNARRQISAHAVELKIRAAAQTGIGTKARFRRKTLRKADFNASFFNWDRPFSGDVLIEILEVIVNIELVFRRVGEFNEMASPRQTSGVRGESEIEFGPNLA